MIGAVVQKVVSGDAMHFYPISSLDNTASAVLIPLDRLAGLAMRHLITKSEIPAVLGHLNDSVPASKGWKQRVLDNAKLFASGSALDLAQIVQSLTQLGEIKELSLRDRETLEKARRFLICEISEVLEESRETAKRQVDRALARRKQAHRADVACATIC
jgi:RNA polymerase-interacting CarD/CdnL/TRCF family regulator